MRTTTVTTLFLLILAGAASSQRTAREIIDHVDRIMRGESSHGIATMDVVTENWQRSMTMEVWSLGTEYSLIRIIAPKKEEGTATLKAGDEIWNYLPRVDRTIKIPASMMMGAWMGSHFTNDDLVKESRLIEDYDIETSFDGDRDGVKVWELTLTPKPEAAVVWGRIEYQIRQDDMMPVWARYYDEDGNLIRTMTFSDYRVMGGRLVPAEMEVRPEDKPGERTTVRYSELEFNINIDKSFFSLRALRSGGR
jgi:outer membrane lipoprotein-sorting protein